MTLPSTLEAKGAASAEDAEQVKVDLVRLFPTWVYSCANGPVNLNEELESLTRTLMEAPGNATRRTNSGGWHYPEDRRRDDSFRLRGWINVNRAGDHNRLHCHPGSFISATYYVRVPDDMKGGNILFRDPRGPAVAMYETPDIELPWVGDGVGAPFKPATGLLLLFPSWLEHSVEAFEGTGERISIAFNASRD